MLSTNVAGGTQPVSFHESLQLGDILSESELSKLNNASSNTSSTLIRHSILKRSQLDIKTITNVSSQQTKTFSKIYNGSETRKMNEDISSKLRSEDPTHGPAFAHLFKQSTQTYTKAQSVFVLVAAITSDKVRVVSNPVLPHSMQRLIEKNGIISFKSQFGSFFVSEASIGGTFFGRLSFLTESLSRIQTQSGIRPNELSDLEKLSQMSASQSTVQISCSGAQVPIGIGFKLADIEIAFQQFIKEMAQPNSGANIGFSVSPIERISGVLEAQYTYEANQKKAKKKIS